jgi:hypothetical protein
VVVNLRNEREGVLKMYMIILAMTYQYSRLNLGIFMINVYLLNKNFKTTFSLCEVCECDIAVK